MRSGSTTAAPSQAGLSVRPFLILASVVVLLLGPFLDKALHIDDPLFVWSAEWIVRHPFDFYGRIVNWYGHDWPMHATNQNPPATAYLLAVVGSVLGWRETTLHGVFLLVAFAASAGIFRLAQLWCVRPMSSTLLAVLTPAFLLSGTSLMCDVPLLACWTWTLVAWERALASRGVARFVLAAALAALAMLTKYTALLLFPVMLTMGAVRRRRPGWWLAALLVPLASAALFELGSRKLYGHGLLFSAGEYASTNQERFPGGYAVRLVSALTFLGGGMLPAIFLLPFLCSRRLLVLAGLLPLAASLLALSSMQRIGLTELRLAGSVRFGLVAQISLFLASGICLLAFIAVELWRRRDALSAVLAVWTGSGLLLLFVFNWTVNGRTLLPTVPAIAILCMRRLELTHPSGLGWKRLAGPMAAALVLDGVIMVADYQLADSARRAANNIVHRHRTPGQQIWFEGHWGFQYYMQNLGALPVDFTRPALAPSDVLVIPVSAANVALPQPGEVELVKLSQMRVFPWLATMQPGSGACFYAADCGPVPFAFGRIAPESYAVLRVLRSPSFR